MATVASTSALQGLERCIVTAANVVDHVTPHKGDWNAFVTGELQSLCEPCYKSAKREIELRGYRTDIELDGYRPTPITRSIEHASFSFREGLLSYRFTTCSQE